MDIRKLQRVIVDGLEDVKAQHILVFNTEHLSALFERVIIASGTSNRQTKSLASSVREAVKKAGYPVPRTEGESNGEWIIIDCGAAVVHVMQPTIRDYYHLEEIWGDKPVSMKLASSLTRLVKAAEPAEPAKKVAAKKVAAKKAVARKTTAATSPARTPAATPIRSISKTAAKTAAKKVPDAAPGASVKPRAKKAATRPIPVVRKTMVVGKPVAKKKVAAPIGRSGVTRTTGVKSKATKSAPAKTVGAVKTVKTVSTTKTPAKKAPGRR